MYTCGVPDCSFPPKDKKNSIVDHRRHCGPYAATLSENEQALWTKKRNEMAAASKERVAKSKKKAMSCNTIHQLCSDRQFEFKTFGPKTMFNFPTYGHMDEKYWYLLMQKMTDTVDVEEKSPEKMITNLAAYTYLWSGSVHPRHQNFCLKI